VAEVLLLAAPVHHSGDLPSMRIMPPPALYVLAAALRQAGFGARVLDPAELRKVQPVEDVSRGSGDVLAAALDGVDAVGISSNTTNWGVARFVAAEVARRRPGAPIIFGGVHPTYFARHVVATTPAGFAVRGEGERALIELLRAIPGAGPGARASAGDVAAIPGVTWRRGDEVVENPDRPWQTREEIAAAPLPAYDLVPQDADYILPIETSRGCRFSCAFCSVPRRGHWEGLEPGWVADRVLAIVDKHGARFPRRLIYLVDDCFTADPPRAADILRRLEAGRLGFRLIVEARATDLLKPGLIDAVPPALVARLAIGVESGYDEGLSRIGKGLTTGELERCCDALSRAGLMPFAYFTFIIGFPWEGERECLKTVHYAAHLVTDYGAQVNLNWLILYPSRLWFDRRRYGIELGEDAFDDPTYLWNDKYFYAAHPSITPEVRARVQQTIDSYNAGGCLLQSA